MKKVKLGIDKAKIKQFFVLHGEKVALGLFSVVFVWMCYAAYQTRGFDKTPQDLRTRTEAIRAEVVNQPFDPNKEGITLPNPPYVDKSKVAMEPVNSLPFMLATLWDLRIYENRVRRDEPKYLPARELQLATSFGAVKLKKAGYTGKRWAVLTALVPFAEQLQAYNEKFENALFKEPAKLDVPRYARFEIERAEVATAKPDPAKIKWQPLDVKAALVEDLTNMAPERPRVVEPKFSDKLLSRGVPPLLGKQPDDTMAHPPEIPFALQSADKDAEKKAAESKPTDNFDPFAQGEEQRTQNVVIAGETKPAEIVPFRLFRFFDYSVESSKSYIYRVRLVLHNPNKGVPKRYLKAPALADGDTRESPWSEVSPVASIPSDYRMLAGDVKPPVGPKESQGKIIVVKWEAPKGVEVAHEFGADRGQELVRGAVLNFSDVDATIPYPDKAETMSGKISFVTNIMMLDMAGGELIKDEQSSARIRAPSEMVFMTPEGNVFTRSAVVDYPEYTARKPAVAARRVEEKPDDTSTPSDGTKPKRTIFDLNN